MGSAVSKVRGAFVRKECCYENLPWTVGEINAAVANEAIAPLTPGCADPTRTSPIFCEICYQYYSKMNVTQCCRHKVCSGCFITIGSHSSLKNCPFCRQGCLAVRPCGKTSEIANPANADDAQYTAFRNASVDLLK
jgi:hypothetical protein